MRQVLAVELKILDARRFVAFALVLAHLGRDIGAIFLHRLLPLRRSSLSRRRLLRFLLLGERRLHLAAILGGEADRGSRSAFAQGADRSRLERGASHERERRQDGGGKKERFGRKSHVERHSRAVTSASPNLSQALAARDPLMPESR